MIKLKNISKFYYGKGIVTSGITKVNLEFNIGEFVAITGESGSGKSTLINVISGLESYEDGEMFINNKETSHYINKDWEKYRKKYIANIYQNFNLINSYTVYQNVELILTLNGINKSIRRKKTLEIIKKVGLTRYRNTKVSKLSGGQKQRVSIARALAKDVPIIVADEPTGNLDKESSKKVIELLKEIAKDKLVIIVTHNYEQVKDYVTRKIVMHDGKVLEDKTIKKYEDIDINFNNNTNSIKLFDLINLSIRNTFNILPKFLLLFFIYLFIVVALFTEYGMFKQNENSVENKSNMFFGKIDDKRIVLNKNDRSSFTKEEIENIKNINNVDYVVTNDLLIDNTITLVSDNSYYYFDSYIKDNSLLKKVDYGQLPVNDGEIVLEGSKDDYYLNNEKDSIIGSVLYLYDEYSEGIDKSVSLKVVGINYSDDNSLLDSTKYNVYIDEVFNNKLKFNINKSFSITKINFMDKYYKSNDSNNNFKIMTDNNVLEGNAYISDSYNINCPNYNCIGKSIYIDVSNIYYNESLQLNIKNVYNKNNINKLVNIPYYDKNNFEEGYDGVIYINPNDYNKLYDKDTYQISVFVSDELKINEVDNKLKELNYNTYKIKDIGFDDTGSKVVRIIKIIITIIVVIVLFFISYFIIKLIMKSRNTYFAIIRMLGGSKLIINSLITLELFIISTLSYLTYLIILYISKLGYIDLNIINNVIKYFDLIDYIIIYLITIIISFLVSRKYSSYLFKDSCMNIYREEE